jgi:hypothetical protein
VQLAPGREPKRIRRSVLLREITSLSKASSPPTTCSHGVRQRLSQAGKRGGIEAAALLRDIMDIPVVFLTANGDQEPLSSQQIAAAVDSALTEWDSGLGLKEK